MTKDVKFSLTDEQLEIVIKTVQRKMATLVRDTIEEVIGRDRQTATEATTEAKILAALANGPLTKTNLHHTVGTGRNGFSRVMARLTAAKTITATPAEGPNGRIVRVIGLAKTQSTNND